MTDVHVFVSMMDCPSLCQNIDLLLSFGVSEFWIVSVAKNNTSTNTLQEA